MDFRGLPHVTPPSLRGLPRDSCQRPPPRQEVPPKNYPPVITPMYTVKVFSKTFLEIQHPRADILLLQTYWSWCWPACSRRVCSAKVASGWSLRNECGCALVNSAPTLRPDLDPMSKLGAALATTTATVFGNAISAMNWWDPVMPWMRRRVSFDQDGKCSNSQKYI